VSVIICVIATKVSYPHPLFYRTVSYTHPQPSIRTSDLWLLHAGVFAALHAPVSHFPQTPLCFSADRIEMFSQLSLPITGKNQHQRQGFSSPLLRRQQPTFSNIFFFSLHMFFPNILFFPLFARLSISRRPDVHCYFLFLLSVRLSFFRLPQRLRLPGTLKSQLIRITQKMNRNEKLSTSLRRFRCVSPMRVRFCCHAGAVIPSATVSVLTKMSNDTIFFSRSRVARK
jgi:hypothetical protein